MKVFLCVCGYNTLYHHLIEHMSQNVIKLLLVELKREIERHCIYYSLQKFLLLVKIALHYS